MPPKQKEKKMDLNKKEVRYLITTLALEYQDEVKHYGYQEEKKTDFLISHFEGRKRAEEKLKNSFIFKLIKKLQKAENNL